MPSIRCHLRNMNTETQWNCWYTQWWQNSREQIVNENKNENENEDREREQKRLLSKELEQKKLNKNRIFCVNENWFFFFINSIIILRRDAILRNYVFFKLWSSSSKERISFAFGMLTTAVEIVWKSRWKRAFTSNSISQTEHFECTPVYMQCKCYAIYV